MPLVFPLSAMLRKLWGRPPGLRGTPSSRIRNNGVSVLQGASRPTGASAAVQGDRPTIYAGAQHRKNEWHWLAKLPRKRVTPPAPQNGSTPHTRLQLVRREYAHGLTLPGQDVPLPTQRVRPVAALIWPLPVFLPD